MSPRSLSPPVFILSAMPPLKPQQCCLLYTRPAGTVPVSELRPQPWPAQSMDWPFSPVAWDWPVLPSSLSMSATLRPYLGQPRHVGLGVVAGIQLAPTLLSEALGSSPAPPTPPPRPAALLLCCTVGPLGTEAEACVLPCYLTEGCVSPSPCGRHHSASFLGTRILPAVAAIFGGNDLSALNFAFLPWLCPTQMWYLPLLGHC